MLRREKQPILFDGIYPGNEINKEKEEKIVKNVPVKKAIKKEKPKILKKKKAKKATRIKKKNTFKVLFTVFATIKVLSLIFLLAIYIGFGAFYKGRVFPGVFVLGENKGGQYGAELKKSIREKLDNTKISFQVGEKEEPASLNELGVVVDSDLAASWAESVGRSGDIRKDATSRFFSFLYWLSPEKYQKIGPTQTVELSYTLNPEKVNEFSKKIFDKYKSPEQNASLIIKGSNIEVLPAKYGEKIIVDSLERQVAESLGSLKDGKKLIVGISKEKVMPNIKEEGLTATVAKTKSITEKKIVLKFENKNYIPTKEVIASWVKFEEKNNILTPSIDQGKLELYLKGVAKEIDIAALPRKIKVENGVKETVEEEGKEGRSLDVRANSGEIKYALENGNVVINHNLKVNKVEPQLIKNRVLVADWAKYIDIDLTAQRMTAYENKNPVFSDLITSGKKGYLTPVGTYLVYGKTRAQTMKGGSGAEYYNLPNVQWISWFNGEIAIHGAYWRTNFGNKDYLWNGSHGCINARNSSAEWIYNWAPKGTPIVVHY